MMTTSLNKSDVRKFSGVYRDIDSLTFRFSEIFPGWISRTSFAALGDAFHYSFECVVLGEVWIIRIHTETGFIYKRQETGLSEFHIHFMQIGCCRIIPANGTAYSIENGQAHLNSIVGSHHIEIAPGTVKTVLRAPLGRYSRFLPVEVNDPKLHLADHQPVLPMDDPIALLLYDTSRILLAPDQERSPLEGSPETAALYKEALLRTLVFRWPLSGTGSKKTSGGAIPASLRRALQWMNDHYREKLAVADMATAAGVSTRTIQSLFKSEFGLSPIQYLIKIRLRHVHEVLTDPANTEHISNIAIRAGFSGYGDFERYYKRQYGRLPSETRRLMRQSFSF